MRPFEADFKTDGRVQYGSVDQFSLFGRLKKWSRFETLALPFRRLLLCLGSVQCHLNRIGVGICRPPASDSLLSGEFVL